MNTHVTLQQIAELPRTDQERMGTWISRFLADLNGEVRRQQARAQHMIEAGVELDGTDRSQFDTL